ncbi:hypothetical protein Tco_0572475 [Tanacetum coccineum]
MKKTLSNQDVRQEKGFKWFFGDHFLEGTEECLSLDFQVINNKDYCVQTTIGKLIDTKKRLSTSLKASRTLNLIEAGFKEAIKITYAANIVVDCKHMNGDVNVVSEKKFLEVVRYGCCYGDGIGDIESPLSAAHLSYNPKGRLVLPEFLMLLVQDINIAWDTTASIDVVNVYEEVSTAKHNRYRTVHVCGSRLGKDLE